MMKGYICNDKALPQRLHMCICIFTRIFSACTYKECTVYIYYMSKELFIKGKMERLGSFHPAGGARIRDSSVLFFPFSFFPFHTQPHTSIITSLNPHWTRYVDKSDIGSVVGMKRVNPANDSHKNQLKCTKVKSPNHTVHESNTERIMDDWTN